MFYVELQATIFWSARELGCGPRIFKLFLATHTHARTNILYTYVVHIYVRTFIIHPSTHARTRTYTHTRAIEKLSMLPIYHNTEYGKWITHEK